MMRKKDMIFLLIKFKMVTSSNWVLLTKKTIKNPVKKFKNQQKQTKENKNKIYKKSKKKIYLRKKNEQKIERNKTKKQTTKTSKFVFYFYLCNIIYIHTYIHISGVWIIWIHA